MAGSTQISSDAASPILVTGSSTRPDERAKSDLWIFRDGCREVSGRTVVRDLTKRLASQTSLIDALIEAGELEAALADLNAPGASAAAALTDTLALRLFGGIQVEQAELERRAARIEVPQTISISAPEGFAYYALHPSDYARVVKQIASASKNFAVIGIRSIGTTLSAVTAAALNAEGRPAERITVRPTGHPYARTVQFSPEHERWILAQSARSADFLVVDEGPGRSGSTFLSVAEALMRMKVPQACITAVGSREFDPEDLCAEDAATRWRSVGFTSTASSIDSRFQSFPYLGGGDWRMHSFDNEEDWPESWTQMERIKFLSPDRRQFFKFEGMGPRGIEVRERAFILAENGFSPSVSDAGDGFLCYQSIEGRKLRKQDVRASVLERIAQYCSFRVSNFTYASPFNSELANMLKFNVQQEFGREVRFDPELLGSTSPVLVDGRMQPFEWIASPQGELLKTDAISHGDNHFFPGPCDITWDLAGAIVEWDLSVAAAEFLLRRFKQLSSIDVTQKLDAYMLAYCVFRLGFCKMAASTVLGSPEESRLEIAYRWYRSKAAKLLDAVTEHGNFSRATVAT
ncbi:MAG: hypothetical protein ACRD3P_00480 [Terriglobales bacterium]